MTDPDSDARLQWICEGGLRSCRLTPLMHEIDGAHFGVIELVEVFEFGRPRRRV